MVKLVYSVQSSSLSRSSPLFYLRQSTIFDNWLSCRRVTREYLPALQRVCWLIRPTTDEMEFTDSTTLVDHRLPPAHQCHQKGPVHYCKSVQSP